MKNSVIEILIPKDEPDGFKIVKLAGWIGKAFVVPRADLKDIRDFREFSLPAVYFLFTEFEAEKPLVYVGETDNLYRRLYQWDAAKDDWNVALAFTGESETDVQYLERKCVEEIEKAGRYDTNNAIKPPGRQLSEFRRAANNDFFDKLKFVATVLGFKIFSEIPKEQQAIEIYYLGDQTGKDVFGKGVLIAGGEFLVFAGSKARVKEADSLKKHVVSSVNLRKQLETNGVFKKAKDGQYFEFTRDYIFHSPSAAADAIRGASTNGWTAWKDKNGKTLDENKRK